MRILLLNQYYWPDSSATGQLLTECCDDLAIHHDVTVVTGRPSYDPAGNAQSKGLISRESRGNIRVLRVWSTSFHRSNFVGRIANYITYLATSVIGGFAAPRPDIVIALTDPPPIGLVGALIAATRRVPFVLVSQDIHPESALGAGILRNRALTAILRLSSKATLRAADRIVSIGRDMSARLAELGVPERKITLIYDWADGDALRPLSGPSRLRQERGWEGRFVVMHSGNIGVSQGLESLVAAAAILSDDPEFLFAIVGEGASKTGLQADVDRRGLSNVVFVPYQPREELSDSLGAADIHLVSLKTGLAGYIVPSKVFGIMAAGKPFIAAVEEGTEPAMIIRETGCGILARPDDPGDLVRAIRQARESDLVAMGHASRASFEQRFDRERAAVKYRAMIEELARSWEAGHAGER